MKIALINSEYPSPSGHDHGGIATYTYTLASALHQQGHRVHVFIREGTVPDRLAEGVKIHTYNFKPPRSSRRILNRFQDGIVQWELGHARDIRDQLNAIYAREGLDVAEFPDYGGLSALCTQKSPFKVVINFHTPSRIVDMLNNTEPTSQRKKWYRYESKAVSNANLYRSPSIAMRDEVCDLFKIDKSKVTVIRNPVSTVPFDRIRKNHPRNSIDILFAGRIEQRKGAGLILKTIRDILNISPKIHMTFAGETVSDSANNYRTAIERALNQEQRNRIWFLGALQSQALSVLYCRSSVFLFPSIFENAPYALFEAIAAKLPVIASASGGIKEIIDHNRTGLLFNYDNAGELTGCLSDFIDNQKHSKEMAEAAYVDLTRNHAPERIAQESISFYQSGQSGITTTGGSLIEQKSCESRKIR